MTEAEKKMKKYTAAVRRRLNLPKEVKTRVMSDFLSSIQARREQGMTDADIYAELGSPKQAAAELNEQMKEYAYQKSPWRFLFLLPVIYGALELIGGLAAQLLYLAMADPFAEAMSIGIIGGADGPTAIFVATPGWMHWINPILILLIGILGYLRLSKCKQK